MSILLKTVMRLAQLQGEAVSRFALHEAIESPDMVGLAPFACLKMLARRLHSPAPVLLKNVDPSMTPALIYEKQKGWGVLFGQNAKSRWVIERFDEEGHRLSEEERGNLNDVLVFKIKLAQLFSTGKSSSFQLVKDEFMGSKSALFEAALGGVMINIVALAVSLFSMQVYDRVVPTGAVSTLQVLTLGVLVAVLFEFVAKLTRAKIYERLVDNVDRRLARSIYLKFLSTRLDQLPASVGGMAALMRGYETARSFLSTATSHLMVDLPFVALYILVIFALAGYLAWIPLAFLLLALLVGIFFRRRVEALSEKSTQASNMKTGLLVETIEGAETIKSGHSGWRMLGKWMATTDEARGHDLEMQALTERSQFAVALLQQACYVLLVAMGALLVGSTELTMGGLIACSILSGRILSPIAAVPGLIMHWGRAKAALSGLDKLWALEDDHAGNEAPVALDQIQGSYYFDHVAFEYSARRALFVKQLGIQPGEKIGVLGAVGAGKTTFLRLLSGMYKPQHGTIMLDGVDLSQISKPVLAESMGYLQQEGRLFAGTLRENLILGLIDPGDSEILAAAAKTGLLSSVIQRHPKGLQLPIQEGGQGLSGGQRQLVNLTRVLLRKPRIWLLDEPSASMDQQSEGRVRMALQQEIQATDTLVLITHKPEMLTLVDRIIVILDQQILIDGPKHEVLEQLKRGVQVNTQAQANAKPTSSELMV